MQNKLLFEVIIVIVLFSLGATAAYFIFNTKVAFSPSPSTSVDETSNWQTYTNDEYGIEIKHPQDFGITEPALIFLPGLVRFSAPLEEFEGTNLVEAYVSVGIGQQPEVRALPSTYCYKNPITGATLSKVESINGVNFYKGDAKGVGAGNIYESTVYRTILEDKCFEIIVTIHTGNVGNYPEGTVTEFDRSLILPTLNKIVSTFKFIR